MKFPSLISILLLISTATWAQKGTLSGKITDKDLDYAPLPFANISVKGKNLGTTSNPDGLYTLSLEPGNYTAIFSFLGYEPIEKSITIISGQTLEINQALGAGSLKLEEVVVQSSINRQRETALLLEQKNAVEMKQNIGAQELSRKGVSDVAGAVAKTSGVAKQEGSGNLYVRGLGDRYNGSTMNGLPIPSNEAERKNIDLEIFPTDIVEYVAIDKVYHSRLYGDFAGGNIDIVSKEHKGKPVVRIEMGMKANTNAVSENNFRLHGVPSAFGFSNPEIPKNPMTEYNYRSMQMENKQPFAGNLGLTLGNNWKFSDQSKLSAFFTASISNDYQSIDQGRANASISGNGVINKEYRSFESFSYGSHTTGLLNLAYSLNPNHKIRFNSLYVNSSKQSTDELRGRVVDLANDGNGLLRINLYKKTGLWVNQLLGDHKVSERTSLNWAGGINQVTDDQPDRTWNFFNQTENGYVINSQSAPNNNRYWQHLQEKEYNAQLRADHRFHQNSDGEFRGKLTLGYAFRNKTRDFNATQFNFKGIAPFTSTLVDPWNIDSFFNAQNLAAGQFTIATFRGGAQVPGSQRPQMYSGDFQVHAAFVSLEYTISPKWFGIFGLRSEIIDQNVYFDTALQSGENQLKKSAFLPNLTLKYLMTENQNLRIAFSKTYTLPQFKERAPFAYERFTQASFGNPDLYESDNYNLDIKWEIFPQAQELFSVTAFGKYIRNPMNEITVNSSTNDISYANTGNYGYALGAEFEGRKILWSTPETNSKQLTAGLNVSYLHTEQELNGEKVKAENRFEADFTHQNDAFTGASKWLANSDISFITHWNEKKSHFMATVTYNYFSDRIFALGTMQRGNLVDKSVGTVDLTLRSALGENVSLRLSAKNLTNPAIRQVQENPSGDVLSQTYKKGLGIHLGMSYTF